MISNSIHSKIDDAMVLKTTKDIWKAGTTIKSTNAPNNEGFVDVEDDFEVTGTYTNEDPTGENAKSIKSNLISYTTEFGSFAQYEVGVVKINITTWKTQDVFVYYGEGQDETTGLATKVISSGDKVIAVSGNLIGSLAADKSDGSKIEIYNSKAQGGAYYVQHPNAVKNGFDDGFVISADADTGDAKWMMISIFKQRFSDSWYKYGFRGKCIWSGI